MVPKRLKKNKHGRRSPCNLQTYFQKNPACLGFTLSGYYWVTKTEQGFFCVCLFFKTLLYLTLKEWTYQSSLFWTQSLDIYSSYVGQGASQEKDLGSQSAYGLSTAFVKGWNISCTSKTGNRGLFDSITLMPRRETQRASSSPSHTHTGKDSHVPLQWLVTVDVFVWDCVMYNSHELQFRPIPHIVLTYNYVFNTCLVHFWG